MGWDKLEVINVEHQLFITNTKFRFCNAGGVAVIQGQLFQARLAKQKKHPRGFSRVDKPGTDVQIIRALDIIRRGGGGNDEQ